MGALFCRRPRRRLRVLLPAAQDWIFRCLLFGLVSSIWFSVSAGVFWLRSFLLDLIPGAVSALTMVRVLLFFHFHSPFDLVRRRGWMGEILLVSCGFVLTLLFCVSPRSIVAPVQPRRPSDASDVLPTPQSSLLSLHWGTLSSIRRMLRRTISFWVLPTFVCPPGQGLASKSTRWC